ncbi:hypothetical protein SBA2_450108 [Acidobacteriia bacterium SbA2]|nr:hypothetical protein SBA2_450108 [Acidobacteriia bacterium SbA2]
MIVSHGWPPGVIISQTSVYIDVLSANKVAEISRGIG